MINVIIVDDHAIYREGIKSHFNADNSIRIINEAENVEEGFKIIKEFEPDVAVIDIHFGDNSPNGLELSRKIKDELPNVQIVITTSYHEEIYFAEAMEIGVSGYVYKDEKPEELTKAICSAYNSDNYISPKAYEKLLNLYRKKKGPKPSGIENLTKRELEIIILISKNMSNKEIAETLSPKISKDTVEVHRENIRKKLNISGKNALLLFALKNTGTINFLSKN